MGYFEKLFNKAMIRIYGSSIRHGGRVLEEGDKDVQLEKAVVNRLVTSSPGKQKQFLGRSIWLRCRKELEFFFREILGFVNSRSGY